MPASTTLTPRALMPSIAACSSAAPDGRVSRPTTTATLAEAAAAESAPQPARIRPRTSATEASVSACASSVACASQSGTSISPLGSTILTPLSISGLCDAVIMRPHAARVARARAATSRPQRKTVEDRRLASARKPAVPYDGRKAGARGCWPDASATRDASITAGVSGNVSNYDLLLLPSEERCCSCRWDVQPRSSSVMTRIAYMNEGAG